MKIARHGFDPGVRHADQRLLEVAVRKADRLEHGARRRTIAPVRNATAAVFEVHGLRDYDTEGSNGNSKRRYNSEIEYKLCSETVGDARPSPRALHRLSSPPAAADAEWLPIHQSAQVCLA